MPLFLAPPAHITPAAFQSFSGDYTGKQDGGTIKLVIKQANDGAVTGTFNDGSSSATLTGKISDDSKKITGQFPEGLLFIPKASTIRQYFQIRKAAQPE